LDPAPAGELTCALSGSVLATFVQSRPYYTAFHVACLKARRELTATQKFFYCACIASNQFRYCYGRQANRTIKDLLIPSPEELPLWVGKEAMTVKSVGDRVAVACEGLALSEA